MALKLVVSVTVMVAALALPIAKGTNVVVEVQPSFVPCSLGANFIATPPFPSKFSLNLLLLVQCTMTTHTSLS